MPSVDLTAQALMTVDEAMVFLQEQGTTVDDNDLLVDHINGVTAMIQRITNRDQLVWVDGDTITEYRRGLNEPSIWLKNAPVRKIASVTLRAQWDSSETIEVPTEPATFSDEMYFDPFTGEVTLKSRTWPADSQAKIIYEAGFYKQDSPTDGSAADPQFMELKMIAQNIIAAKWARWKNKTHGVDSETKGQTSITYLAGDLRASELRELKKYRRNLFV